MKTLFIDGNAGASGDMLLAALLDLAGGRQVLDAGLAKLGLPGFRLVYPPRRRGGIEAAGVEVVLSAEAPHFDDARAVETVLANSSLSAFVRGRAAATFAKLEEAERRAHRVAVGHGGFHEVGALDAVVDVVGTFLLVEAIRPGRIVASPPRLGAGFVKTAHGNLPIPAPATIELLQDVPSFGGDAPGEFTTPTGAALLTSLATDFGPMPQMTITAVGYGPGAADPAAFPNVLRAFLGDTPARTAAGGEEQVVILGADIDDMTPEEVAYAAELIRAAGALDVTVTPTLMKKGRPGYAVAVISRAEDRDALCDLLFRHTTTLGVRFDEVSRRTLSRRVVTVVTTYGAGKVKVAVGPGMRPRFHAEYESAAALAAKVNVAVRDVARALEAAAAAQFRSGEKKKAPPARAAKKTR